jgi:hypothetical protein
MDLNIKTNIETNVESNVELNMDFKNINGITYNKHNNKYDEKYYKNSFIFNRIGKLNNQNKQLKINNKACLQYVGYMKFKNEQLVNKNNELVITNNSLSTNLSDKYIHILSFIFFIYLFFLFLIEKFYYSFIIT